MSEHKCRVPMWQMGVPAGHCDDPAYGPQTAEKRRFAEMTGRDLPYCHGFACPGHGGPDKPITHIEGGK